MSRKLDPIGNSSTGMAENLAALLAVIFAPISSIIFLLLEKDSKYVKFHAIQAIGMAILGIVLMIVSAILAFIPILGWLISIVLYLGLFILWILLLIKSFQGEWFELPVIGRFALEQIERQ